MHPPIAPQISLRADLQQIESKAYYLLIIRQAKRLRLLQAQHSWSVLLVSGRALVILGYGLLLCLLPIRGLKVGNILVLHPTVLTVPGVTGFVVLVLPALFVPCGQAVGTAQTLCRPQCLGVEVFAIQNVDLFRDQRICRLNV